MKIMDKMLTNVKDSRRIKKRCLSILVVLGFLGIVWAASAQVVPAVAKNKEKAKYKIVVDAGHGGFDPGKVGINGALEKDINLSIAKRLKKFLEKENIEVILTRTEDKGLYDEGSSGKKTQDLERRCALIEKEKPLFTIGIHQNSFTDESVKGPQVFFYHTSNEGRSLAEAIQSQLNADLEVKRPREVKDNGTYYMLKKSPSLTVLVECGFISNQEEADLLAGEEYQKKVAKSICKGILMYIKRIENPDNIEIEDTNIEQSKRKEMVESTFRG